MSVSPSSPAIRKHDTYGVANITALDQRLAHGHLDVHQRVLRQRLALLSIFSQLSQFTHPAEMQAHIRDQNGLDQRLSEITCVRTLEPVAVLAGGGRRGARSSHGGKVGNLRRRSDQVAQSVLPHKLQQQSAMHLFEGGLVIVNDREWCASVFLQIVVRRQ